MHARVCARARVWAAIIMAPARRPGAIFSGAQAAETKGVARGPQPRMDGPKGGGPMGEQGAVGRLGRSRAPPNLVQPNFCRTVSEFQELLGTSPPLTRDTKMAPRQREPPFKRPAGAKLKVVERGAKRAMGRSNGGGLGAHRGAIGRRSGPLSCLSCCPHYKRISLYIR